MDINDELQAFLKLTLSEKVSNKRNDTALQLLTKLIRNKTLDSNTSDVARRDYIKILLEIIKNNKNNDKDLDDFYKNISIK